MRKCIRNDYQFHSELLDSYFLCRCTVIGGIDWPITHYQQRRDAWSVFFYRNFRIRRHESLLTTSVLFTSRDAVYRWNAWRLLFTWFGSPGLERGWVLTAHMIRGNLSLRSKWTPLKSLSEFYFRYWCVPIICRTFGHKKVLDRLHNALVLVHSWHHLSLPKGVVEILRKPEMTSSHSGG